MRVTDIDRVEKWLPMEKGRIIDVERQVTYLREQVIHGLVLKNVDVLRDQAAKRVKGQPAYVNNEAETLELMRQQAAPATAKTFFVNVVAGPSQTGQDKAGEAPSNERKQVGRFHTPRKVSAPDPAGKGGIERRGAAEVTQKGNVTGMVTRGNLVCQSGT